MADGIIRDRPLQEGSSRKSSPFVRGQTPNDPRSRTHAQLALERRSQWSHGKPNDNAIARSTYRRLHTPLHRHGSRMDGILALDLF
jgi:hypothetical protein